jgi:transposase
MSEISNNCMAYSAVVKARAVVDYLYFTKSLRKVAKRHKVSKSSLQRWAKEDPNKFKNIQKRSKKPRYPDVLQVVKDAIESNGFMTMGEIAHHLRERTGRRVSARTVNRYAHEVGKSCKKAYRIVDHTHDNRSVKAFCTSFLEAKNVVSIDESCFYVGDHPRRGWCTKGTKLAVRASKSLRMTKFTLLMAVTEEGVLHYKVLDHNCKKPHFITFFKEIPFSEDSTVVMDNISFHHSKEIVQLAKELKVTLLHTPPYSPRCNPIEKVFGALKPRYRRASWEIPKPSEASVYRQRFEELVALEVASNRSSDRPMYVATFESTRRFLRETVANIDLDASFRFVGYDRVGEGHKEVPPYGQST